MNPLEIIGSILLILTSILIILVIELQSSKSSGMGSLFGQEAASIQGRNRAKTMDAMLAKVTKILAVVFFVVTIVVYAFAIFMK